jgi:hypothetical protein
MKNLLMIAMLMVTACAAHPKLGDDLEVHLDCGLKVTNISWDRGELWVATRSKNDGEYPKSHTFQRYDASGDVAGSVLIHECM